MTGEEAEDWAELWKLFHAAANRLALGFGEVAEHVAL